MSRRPSLRILFVLLALFILLTVGAVLALTLGPDGSGDGTSSVHSTTR